MQKQREAEKKKKAAAAAGSSKPAASSAAQDGFEQDPFGAPQDPFASKPAPKAKPAKAAPAAVPAPAAVAKPIKKASKPAAAAPADVSAWRRHDTWAGDHVVLQNPFGEDPFAASAQDPFANAEFTKQKSRYTSAHDRGPSSSADTMCPAPPANRAALTSSSRPRWRPRPTDADRYPAAAPLVATSTSSRARCDALLHGRSPTEAWLRAQVEATGFEDDGGQAAGGTVSWFDNDDDLAEEERKAAEEPVVRVAARLPCELVC
jgi:hypothetical protein